MYPNNIAHEAATWSRTHDPSVLSNRVDHLAKPVFHPERKTFNKRGSSRRSRFSLITSVALPAAAAAMKAAKNLLTILVLIIDPNILKLEKAKKGEKEILFNPFFLL